jgi:ketosteroid isomerase-like protein
MSGHKPKTTATAEQQIRDRTDKWEQAHGARDVAALDELLHPAYVYTDATGTLQSRAEYLTSVFKSPDISLNSKFTTSGVVIRIFGATAVVTGQSSWKGRPRGKGQFQTGRYQFTDVWVEHAGRWRAVATQGTCVHEAQP